MLTIDALPLNEPLKCLRCHGSKVVDSPEAERAREYWSGCNSGSFRSRDYPGPVACPCCGGIGTKTFTGVSERLQGLLDQIAREELPEVKNAPAELAGDDWWYLWTHPQIVCHKLGFSSNYWFYLRGDKFSRRAACFPF